MSDELNVLKKNYEKLGGWLLVFVICQGVFFALNTLAVFGNALFFNTGLPNFYTIMMYIFQVCISVFYINAIIKKPPNALFHVRNLLRVFAILGVAPFVLIVFLGQLQSEYEYSSTFLFNPFMIALVIFNLSWQFGWFMYFKKSKRAAVYFGILDSKSIGNIQEAEKNMEQEVIDAFMQHNAVSKETAVDPKLLSIDILDIKGKHALIVHNMRFMNRQIIEVNGKFYYDASSKGKYIGNVPVKFFKVIGIILLICLIILLIANILIKTG